MPPRRREEEAAAAEDADADLLDAGDFDRTVALGGMHFRSFFSFRVTDTDFSSSSSSSSSIQKDLPDGYSYTTWA